VSFFTGVQLTQDQKVSTDTGKGSYGGDKGGAPDVSQTGSNDNQTTQDASSQAETDQKNINVPISILSVDSDNGDVSQGNWADTTAKSSNDKWTDQDLRQKQDVASGRGSGDVSQPGENNKSTDQNASSEAQTKQNNVNVPISILSFGSNNGDVHQGRSRGVDVCAQLPLAHGAGVASFHDRAVRRQRDRTDRGRAGRRRGHPDRRDRAALTAVARGRDRVLDLAGRQRARRPPQVDDLAAAHGEGAARAHGDRVRPLRGARDLLLRVYREGRVPAVSGFASRWVVLQRHDVGPGDFDADGVVRAEVVDGWLAAARTAYLDKCVVLQSLRDQVGGELQASVTQPPARDRIGAPTAVLVTAGATELLPDAITIAFRIRPLSGEGDDGINAACSVSLVDPDADQACELGNDVRDELIALEHAAEHVN
jgi:hypothetical protein